MWKLLVAFVLFAVIAVYALMKGGANVDMGGEKHATEVAAPEPAASAAAGAASAVVAPVPASAASH